MKRSQRSTDSLYLPPSKRSDLGWTLAHRPTPFQSTSSMRSAEMLHWHQWVAAHRHSFKCRKNSQLLIHFHIVDHSAPPVPAIKACCNLNLVKTFITVTEDRGKIDCGYQSTMQEYAAVFQGIFPGDCNFHVDPNQGQIWNNIYGVVKGGQEFF